jgi:RNA polymerase sigma factor (sigma-70 family)
MTLGTILRGRPRRQPTVPAIEPDAAADGDLLNRFARHGDQLAFAALVRRHGPLVLGVCRRILRDSHAADDAFQSTFLVLARRADSIARPEAVASWLYGVALRVSLKARAALAARAAPGHLVESASAAEEPVTMLAGRELRLALDEELARMPERDRALLVLVYLEGRTHEEAARAVGCPLGSLAWRLARARENLRKRLDRRGVALSIGLLLLLASAGRGQAVSDDLAARTAAAAKGTRPIGGLGVSRGWGRRVPVGCLLPLAALFAAAAIGSWVALAREWSQSSLAGGPVVGSCHAADAPGK